MYENELLALQKSNRYRKREIYDEELLDLASNDYLGFAQDKELFEKAVKDVSKYKYHAPKASQLVNGYHQIHHQFEQYLCQINDFEDAIVVGSGFLANLSLIEALPRKKDLLILDEYYHASGILASRLVKSEVVFFKHNDATDLERILKTNSYKRAIVAVEGIYSMIGDLLEKEIFNVADKYQALLIVDEAHSSGVLGEKLLGIFDHYKIRPQKNHIKMGTLGKAMGSYGAYILASNEIISFLQNRAKAIIYATAPSVFDTALALQAFKKTQTKTHQLSTALQTRINTAQEIFNQELFSPILTIDMTNSSKAMRMKELVKEKGFLIGAIRPPTVKTPILRIILRLGVDVEKIREILYVIKENHV